METGLDIWRSRLARGSADRALYVLAAGIATLLSLRTFAAAMMAQTGGEWSAPLDDVFIHFDYARSTALGHPFEWVGGNGYSSGNTSLSYPFALAIGYLAGFHDQALVPFAMALAATCTFAFLLVSRRFFSSEPRAGRGASSIPRSERRWRRLGSYVLPFLFFRVGALAWSLWSGMEVAFFLGVWAVAAAAWLNLERAALSARPRRAWVLSAAGALLVLTRPEAATSVAVFGLFAAARDFKQAGSRRAAGTLLRVASLPAAGIVAQAIANHYFTGDSTANGALAKLALYNPFAGADFVWEDWTGNLRYVVFRLVEHHFTDDRAYGAAVVALALAPLAIPGYGRTALLLWTQIVLWCAVTALNAQVHWQNERYVMPPVAWLLVLSASGAVALAGRLGRPSFIRGALAFAGAVALAHVGLRGSDAAVPEVTLPAVVAIGAGLVITSFLSMWPARIAAGAALLAIFFLHGRTPLRDQAWFFGRACRNIRDQHVVAGRYLERLAPNRVLVGDAGALVYASKRPGLDIIGLGGYHDLPFARANVQGLPAVLELIERIPPRDRPAVMAIFPTWWGSLPTFFTDAVLARFPVEGNVICGGYEDVVYRADWRLLGTGEMPRVSFDGERVRDALDVGDLVSEKAHAYPFPAGAWPDMKILADPSSPREALFDAGRRIGRGRSERFSLFDLTPGKAAHLLVRIVPEMRYRVRVQVDGAEVGLIDAAARDTWLEAVVEIPGVRIGHGSIRVELHNEGPGDFVDYHVWVSQ